MNIRMIGIDHNKASIEEREIFSFTKKASAEMIINLKNQKGVLGVIIISTCNRMELWVSYGEEEEVPIYDILCAAKGVNPDTYRDYFIEKTGYEAVSHLFYLAGGMESKIIGEDQILTQVKDSLNFSRENDGTDKILEVLFRMAITAGKKIKTDFRLSANNSSIIHRVIHELKVSGYTIQNKKCMVIGNGEMGKLAANMLREEGADVVVTVRQYKSGMVSIPIGCRRINYGERLEYIPGMDMVISVTASPNATLTYEQIKMLDRKKPKLMVDLAVPRDMEPQIGELDGITLYDIDQFKVDLQSEEMKLQIDQIKDVLKQKTDEFISWYECKDIIPAVKSISENAAVDVQLRIDKIIKQLPMKHDDKELLEKSIEAAAIKVVNKLMFGLRDTVSSATFQECVEAIENIYHQGR